MNKYLLKALVPSVLLLCLNCYAQVSIKPGSAKVKYMGRVNLSQDSALFYWPGTSAEINFYGTGVSATMKSVKEEGFFYAIVDNDDLNAFKFKTDSEKKSISLAKNLPAGKHSLQLYKLSDCTSKNIFYGFEIETKGKILTPSKLPKRKIEFYGNSITAGYGVDVPAGMEDSGLPQFYNSYYTYAALTARHYNAQYSFIARSGIGIMVSWYPEIMPEVYDRIDPFDEKKKWGFQKYTPDVVVINLFQNDSWIVNNTTHPEFKHRFGNTRPSDEFIITSYKNFVAGIRSKYPKAHIICALGSMDATRSGSKWPGYIRDAITKLNDKKIYSIVFPYKERSGHPNRTEQQMMSEHLIKFIDENIKW